MMLSSRRRNGPKGRTAWESSPSELGACSVLGGIVGMDLVGIVLTLMLSAAALQGCVTPTPLVTESDVPREGRIDVIPDSDSDWALKDICSGKAVGWSRPGLTEEAFDAECRAIVAKGVDLGMVSVGSSWPGRGVYLDGEFVFMELLARGYRPVPPDRCQSWQIFPSPLRRE